MRPLFLAITFLVTLGAQDNFIGDVFEKGSINYGDRTIQAIGIGFIPENVINAGQARRSAAVKRLQQARAPSRPASSSSSS